MALEDRRWLKAASISGALLIVPLVGFVLLLVLPLNGADSEDEPQAGEAVNVIGSSTAKPRSASGGKPTSPTSQLESCCKALKQRTIGTSDPAILQIYADASIACADAVKAGNAEAGLQQARSAVQGARAELPAECR